MQGEFVAQLADIDRLGDRVIVAVVGYRVGGAHRRYWPTA